MSWIKSIINRVKMKKKKSEPLNFFEYYEKYRTPFNVLAKNCGVTFNQIYNIYRGGCPTLVTALALEAYTNGEVTCESLLPERYFKKIEKIKKHE